ncbi:hypothetical protein A8W33_004494 [Escherichia coli]|nr:hypothetical protein [Escherichia coli]
MQGYIPPAEAKKAYQRERNTQFFSVITVELDPVREPSLITFFHSHSAYMCPFRWRYNRVTLKQQRILAHDVNATLFDCLGKATACHWQIPQMTDRYSSILSLTISMEILSILCTVETVVAH